MVRPARVQFSLASLLTVIAILSALCASIAYGGLAGAWVGSPIVLAAIAVLLEADARRLRQFCFTLFACQALVFLLLAGMSYPIIVIADSDLGASAMARVGDWLRLSGACLLGMVVIAASHFTTRMTIRLALTLVILWWIVTLRFQSPVTPIAARMVLVGLAAILLAADGLKKLTMHFPDCPSPLRSILVMAVGGLLLLTDWQGRVYLGLLPSSHHSPVQTRMKQALKGIEGYQADLRCNSLRLRV